MVTKKNNDRPHAAILSHSVIELDPRVRKFAQTLYDNGWQVTTIGLPMRPNADPVIIPWRHIAVDIRKKVPSQAEQIQKGNSAFGSVLQRLSKQKWLLPASWVHILGKMASRSERGESLWSRLRYYWDLRFGLRIFPAHYALAYWQSDQGYQAFLDTADKQVGSADLWIANDWEMLPIALTLKAKKGGKILYDSHEYAIEQFIGDKQWRQFMQPLVKAVENSCIHQVDAVSSVSPGLCRTLQTRYALEQTPHCIRNVPPYQQYDFQPCNTPRIVLYQGVIGPGRGLEEVIKSTPLWHKDFHLVIRGPEGRKDYISHLQQIIDEAGAAIKISIEPPVPVTQMIAKAHKADIGLLALPSQSVHNRYALPNKIFEYMMAGLALCVTTNEDMANILAHHRNGTLIESFTPASIAKAVNSMDAENINAGKNASLQAARTLNWEAEQAAFLAICTSMRS